MKRTVFYAAAMTGGNMRAAPMSGLPVRRLMVLTCFLAGAAAGTAGMIEVAAVALDAPMHLSCAGYGSHRDFGRVRGAPKSTGVIPVALLLGGIGASGSLLQRNFNLPDASVNVLQGDLVHASSS